MRILVAYDGSEPSKKALDRAVGMARPGVDELILLTVMEPVCPLGVTVSDCALMDGLLRKQTEGIPREVKEDLAARKVIAAAEVRTGLPAEEIVEFAREQDVDSIVMGSHGRHGAARFFLGSVSARVLAHADCTVTIVR